MPHPPHKLTIITISLNNREGLRRTIESVVNQTCQDFEYIVIDGSSTDGSVEVIQEYPRIDYWISEPDTGIYNAMNKGIAKTTGEYCLFLNSGDTLFNVTTIEKLADYLRNLNGMFLIGNVHTNKGFAGYTHQNIFESNVPHQAIFYHLDLFKKHGTFDENYAILGDWDYHIRLIESNKHLPTPFDLTIAVFDLSGLSGCIGSTQYRNDIIRLYTQTRHLWKKKYANPLLWRMAQSSFKCQGLSFLWTIPKELQRLVWLHAFWRYIVQRINTCFA